MGCVASVTRVLQAVKGVGKVDVSLEQALASVEYDPGVATKVAIREAVESAGFDATL
jgi:copper chaperone